VELAPLRGRWLELGSRVVAADPDWSTALLQELPGEGRPHVVAFERDGTVDALAVGNVRTRTLPCKVGRKAVYSPRARTLSVVEDGFLGCIDDESAAGLVSEFVAAVDRGEADLCYLLHVPSTSPIRAAVRARVGGVRRAHGTVLEQRWSRDLPPSYEGFLATLSSQMRKGMRQTRRRLERSVATSHVRTFLAPDDVDEFLHDAEVVARRSYQWKLGVGFSPTDLTRWSIAEAARRNLLRAWVLYADSHPIAFEWGVAYNATFRWVAGGFDPAYAEHRPGMYLIGRAIEALCADPSVARIDFGLGSGEYKARLGCTYELEGDILIAASRPRALCVLGAYSAATLVTQADRALR
jgi:hypothetical protein